MLGSIRPVQLLLGWLVLSLLALILFPRPDIAYQAQIPRLGEISTKPYISPVSFEVPKSPDQLKQEQDSARSTVLPVFDYQSSKTQEIMADFEMTLQSIRQYARLKELAATQAGKEGEKSENEAMQLFRTINVRLSSTAIEQLAQHPAARDSLRKVFQRIIKTGVADILIAANPKQITLYKDYHNRQDLKSLLYAGAKVSLIRNEHEMQADVTQIRPREAVIEDAFSSIQISSQSQGIQSAFYEALYVFIKPNIIYRAKETERRKQAEAAEVNPIQGVVVKGQEILPVGSIVTQEAIMRLKVLHHELEQQEGSGLLTSSIGQGLLIFLGILSFVLWLALFQNNSFRTSREFTAILIVHGLQVVLIALSARLAQEMMTPDGLVTTEMNTIWLAPMVLAPALSTVLFNYRVGISSSMFGAIYLGMQSGYDLGVAIVFMLTALASIRFLHQIRYRYDFLLSSISSMVTLAFGLFLLHLLRNNLTWAAYWPPLVQGTLSIIASLSISSLFLIHLFERLFQITTNLTMIELSDFNHPALKKISESAPGSFHHSIMVGNLAEKAAARIDANPLLTRVMALYHDLGKTVNPQYFTENQTHGENPHDQMTPWESVKVIQDHVTEGLAMASEYGIPSLIAAGIPEHHGDNVIHYFWKKAVQENPEKNISPDDFRYAGPKAQSKETAILMMADSIEATSRAMEAPDAEKLTQLVRDVIQTRLAEGQLGESGLTLRDLAEIERGFLQSLEGMYHARIQYPEGVFISSTIPSSRPENHSSNPS